MTHDFFFIEQENVPCFYELSWDGKMPTMIVRAHKDFLVNWPELENSPIVTHFMEKFKFSRFESEAKNSSFGFEGVFERVADEGDFAVFRAIIPVVEKQSEIICPVCMGDKKSLFGNCFRCNGSGKIAEICQRCNGTKEDDFGVCLECSGKGIKTYFDWNCVFAISATFTVFFEMASLQLSREKATFCRFPQLILVNTATDEGMHGGSLDGTYSILLAKWLSAFKPDTEITEMTEAMIRVWKKMFGRVDEYDRHSFYARVANQNGWLNVSCSGDRCGLHPADSWGPERGRGYKFSCHNVDNPAQQITLLAGLAALCDKARKEIKVF